MPNTHVSLYHLINKPQYCTHLLSFWDAPVSWDWIRESVKSQEGEPAHHTGIKGLLQSDKSSHYVAVCHLPPESTF